jgi:membrane carboxypeptidase/penicillin-binding protein PbpC
MQVIRQEPRKHPEKAIGILWATRLELFAGEQGILKQYCTLLLFRSNTKGLEADCRCYTVKKLMPREPGEVKLI